MNPQLQQITKPQVDKRRFSALVRIWIMHKKAIAQASRSNLYRSGERLKSMRQLNSLLTMVRRNCAEYNLRDFCRMVLINEKHLRAILPAMDNPSYKKQLEKLEFILTTARTYNSK